MSDTSNKQSLKKILSHPLLLLVAGAIFTSLLFPSITRQWQANEKQIELKSELMDEINEATADTLTSYRLSMGSYAGNVTDRYLDSTVQWQKKREILLDQNWIFIIPMIVKLDRTGKTYLTQLKRWEEAS